MSDFRAVVGHSADPESVHAAAALIAQVEAGLPRPPQAGVLYAGIDYDHHALLDTLLARWPDMQLVGCTTDGEASSVGGFQENSVSLMAFESDRVRFGTGLGTQVSADPDRAGATAVAMAQARLGETPRLGIVLPESLTASGVALLDGVRAALPGQVPIVGGTAGDQWRLKHTRQFHLREVTSDACPVLLMGGDLHVSVGVQSGWRPVGRRGVVTRSEGNVVHEIDGAPAVDFYSRYLGSNLTASLFVGDIPLAVFDPEGRFFLRAPAGANEQTGAMTFFADVATGATVQLTVGAKDDVLAASRSAVVDAVRTYPGTSPDAALFFSCAARKQVLGTQASEEIGLLRGTLPPDVPVCGFYAYGEIGPLVPGGASRFHNETFVAVLVGTH
ncbi:MAG: hypothetical protein HOP14_03550 [Acidobacteria bacterium]|nr:hypothetical protein [Acidobacteriota bacterium]